MTHPAPKTQQPIRDDPKVGQYQVVVSFRAADPQFSEETVRRRLFAFALDCFATVLDLDVAIREIGVGGERMEHEGTVGLDVTEDADYGRPQNDVPTRGRT